jgi:protein involved in sex pheromone biosynthesis
MMRQKTRLALSSVILLLSGCATTSPQIGAEVALKEGQRSHNGMAMVLSKESNETRLHGSVGLYYQHTSD